MKANEFRIGNYVNEKYWSEVTKTFDYSLIIVNAIYKTHIVCQDDSAYNLDDIEPIKLTEEILLKCGFWQYGSDKKAFEIHDVIISFTEKKIWIAQSGAHEAEVNLVEYLHQLQNLYFALTNEELTFNNKL